MSVYPNKIKDYRKAAGLTQWQLAEQLGTSQARLWQWEAGVTPVRFVHRQRIAEILKVNIEAIWNDTGAIKQ